MTSRYTLSVSVSVSGPGAAQQVRQLPLQGGGRGATLSRQRSPSRPCWISAEKLRRAMPRQLAGVRRTACG